LTFYTLSLRRRDLPGAYLPKDRLRVEKLGEREFATDGETLFGAFCTGCHGAGGMGLRAPGVPNFPSVANPDFLSLVTDEFLLETVRQGRPGRKMPAWGQIDGGLRPEEIREVVQHLRRLGGTTPLPDPKPRRWVQGNAEAGRHLYAAACSGCHGPKGEGGEGPALNNPVLLSTATDTFLVQTISRGRRQTAMEGFLAPSPARRTLSLEEVEDVVAFIRSWEGAKP
jgi:cytochrome c oxidase cbb3-type subunit 3